MLINQNFKVFKKYINTKNSKVYEYILEILLRKKYTNIKN